MELENKKSGSIILDMEDYQTTEEINSVIINSEDFGRLVGYDITHIVLNDNVTRLQYVFSFDEFSMEFIPLTEYIFINKGLKHFSYVREKKQLGEETDIVKMYLNGRLTLLVKNITHESV